MERQLLREDEIRSILPRLTSSDHVEREQAFEALCSYLSNPDIEFAYSALLQKGDTQSIYWLVHYLVRIECPLGFEKLFLLVQNANATIREEACWGISNIAEETRNTLLLKMLQFPWKTEVRFAIQQLGVLRRTNAVSPLMRVLETHRDEEIGIDVIHALTKIGDTRAVRCLEKLAMHPTAKIQDEAFAALGRFVPLLHRKFLKRCFASENPRTREIAYMTVLRLQLKRWEKHVAVRLNKETDGQRKIRVLSSVKSLKSRKLFEAIFVMARQDPDSRVRMIAQSVIKRLRAKRLKRWLFGEYHQGDFADKVIALRLLAEYAEESDVEREYEKIYRQSTDPAIRLIVLDIMGRTPRKSSREFLCEIIRKQDSYAYAAACALTDIMDPDLWEIVKEVLTMDEKKMSPVIQVLLDFVLRLPKRYVLPEAVAVAVGKLMESPNYFIRYLAVRCYANTQIDNHLPELLKVAGIDNEKAVRKGSFKEAVRVVGENPRELVNAFNYCFAVPSLYPVLHKLFEMVAADRMEILQELFKKLLDVLQKFRTSQKRKRRFDEARLYLLMRSQVLQSRCLFMGLLESGGWDDDEREVLIRVLNLSDFCDVGLFNVDFMAAQYEKSSPKTKVEFLEFFKNMEAPSAKIEDTVFQALASEQDPLLCRKIQDVIAAWFSRAQAQGFQTSGRETTSRGGAGS
ncbi:MAG: hypothetical protein PHN49_08825 [Candidatus Omnitrophica bacterium]|nr:hypothetical protein [Candidatus Omnitrophota bacterium]MDD5671728.1 hypothetical protein [Candidatus Omnitrophota bacterium]